LGGNRGAVLGEPGFIGGIGMGRRASVAVGVAAMVPGFLIAIALAVEVGAWAAAQVSVQRVADIAALAGAFSQAPGRGNDKHHYID
jgi:uncharacterized membrane protein